MDEALLRVTYDDGSQVVEEYGEIDRSRLRHAELFVRVAQADVPPGSCLLYRVRRATGKHSWNYALLAVETDGEAPALYIAPLDLAPIMAAKLDDYGTDVVTAPPVLYDFEVD